MKYPFFKKKKNKFIYICLTSLSHISPKTAKADFLILKSSLLVYSAIFLIKLGQSLLPTSYENIKEIS